MATKELKIGQLTRKDMSVLRENESARTQHKKTTGSIKDYSLNHVIHMSWGIENSRQGLLPFCLSIDRKPFYLSWIELKDLERTGFFRREEGARKKATLRYLDGGKLTLDTDLNEEAERDMIFRITGKNIEAYVDWYEILRLGRFI